MLKLKSFTVGPFQENTYLIWDNNLIAAIIDPGMSNNSENQLIKNFITENGLQLKRLLLTHAHIDHIMGNKFIFDEYGLLPEVHEADVYFIDNLKHAAEMYELNCEESPKPKKLLQDEEILELGELKFECIHTPGHSPGSITFFFEKERVMIVGDVLFNGSIGRTDLPLSNPDAIIPSIMEKLLPKGDDIKVYSGHGPSTTIGKERTSNMFLI